MILQKKIIQVYKISEIHGTYIWWCKLYAHFKRNLCDLICVRHLIWWMQSKIWFPKPFLNISNTEIDINWALDKDIKFSRTFKFLLFTTPDLWIYYVERNQFSKSDNGAHLIGPIHLLQGKPQKTGLFLVARPLRPSSSSNFFQFF